MLYKFSRHAADNGIRLYIFRHYSAGSNNSIVSNGHTGQNSDVRTQPDSFPDMDWSREEVVPLLRIWVVVECGEYGIVADQSAVIDCDSALILESAAGVNEYVFSDLNILSAVGIEGREETKGRIDRASGQAFHNLPYFVRSMIGAIELRRNSQCFL